MHSLLLNAAETLTLVYTLQEFDASRNTAHGYLQLDGRTAAKDRENYIKRFANPMGPKVGLQIQSK